jgi:hypothetical protein
MNASSKNLDEWLKIATGEVWAGELAGPAKERIKLEIKSHFEDAVAAHLAEGLTEAEAQARALADLGDAHAARKRFRKTHLMEWEANSLKSTLFSKMRWWLCGLSWVEICIQNLWRHLHNIDRVPLLFPVVSTAILWGVEAIYARVAFHHDYRSRLRLLFTIEALAWLNFSLLIGYRAVWGHDWVSAIIPFSIILPRLSFWLKIWKSPEVRQELTPPGPAERD